jgi:hypothetical protein
VAGRFALRLAIGGTLTERRHVEAAWRTLAAAADGHAPTSPPIS